MAEGPVLEWLGLIVSEPAEVLVELAAVLEEDDLVIAADYLLGPTCLVPGIRRADLLDALHRSFRRPGVRRAARAIAQSRPGVESPGETRTRLLLVRAGFPEPIPNVPIEDPDTGQIRRIDCGYPGLRIGAEYDGDVHRDKDRWREDRSRQDSLESIGWRLRRLTAVDIARPARFLHGMSRAFASVGAPAPSPERWSGSRELDLVPRRLRYSPSPH